MKYRKQSKGVALLLALGFLSLFLAMGVAFVSNTMISQKSAANFRSRAQARSLAMSAANRIATEVRYTMDYNAHHSGENEKALGPEKITSVANAEDTDDDVTLKDKNSLLTSIVWGVKFIPEYLHGAHYKDDSVEGNTLPRWQYWYDKYDSTQPDKPASDAQIIGRVAYMALTPSASINLSEVLRGAPEIKTIFSHDNQSWSAWDKRRGASMRELHIDLPPDATNKKNFLSRFSSEKYQISSPVNYITDAKNQDFATDKNTTENTDYQDYDSIFDAAGLTDVTSQNNIRAWFTPSGYNEPEIYAYNKQPITTNTSASYDAATLFYHRFNLARTDASGKSAWESDSASPITVAALLGDPQRFNEKVLYVSDPAKDKDYQTALPWLKSIIGSTETHQDETVYTPTVLRQQVAANLIDYCDSDSIPISDGGTDWATANNGEGPTYTGNEKTPYINEIMIGLEGSVKIKSVPLGGENPTYRNDYTISLNPKNFIVELINIYQNKENSGFEKNMSVYFSGTVNVKITPYENAGEAHTKTYPMTFTTVNSSGVSSPVEVPAQFKTDNASGNYFYMNFSDSVKASFTGNQTSVLEQFSITGEQRTKVDATIELVDLTIDKCYLIYDGHTVDFVRKLYQKYDAASLKCTGNSTDENFNIFSGFAVDDPRMNLYQKTGNVIQWSPLKKIIWENIDITSIDTMKEKINGNTEEDFTIQAKNNVCKPDQSGDKENFGTFSNGELLSTAYIANAPMKSLAELGMIHRGEKWSTINLKKCSARISGTNYDPERAADADDGYTYAQGDAAILDQVKLTKEYYTAGKVHLNRYPETTNKNYLFKALFTNIAYGVNHADEYTTGTRLSTDLAGNIRNVLGGALRTGDDKFLMSRGHFVDFLNKNSDVFREPATNLTDVQKEIIPAVSSALTTSYTTPPDVISYIIVAQTIRDVGTSSGISITKLNEKGKDVTKTDVKKGKFDYKDEVYFDEITGETKMMVTIKIDQSNRTAKIIRAEFID